MKVRGIKQIQLGQLQRLVIQPEQKQGQTIRFSSEQQHYLYRVLRLQSSELMIVMDGQGKSWLVELEGDLGTILQPLIQETELSRNVTLLCGLPKGNGFDEIVRCCTELGVSRFIPVIGEHTLLKPSPNKLQRWRKIAQEATEQSERQVVPSVAEPLSFAQAVDLFNPETTSGYLCVARGDVPHLHTRLQTAPASSLLIATGSEGGWTTAEIQMAMERGFQSVSLGKRILRAITAPIMALSLVAGVLER